jgi:Zn finger protein HypA/HybF involved in hydrogenase expression
LLVGARRGVVPNAPRFSFDVCVEGTPLAGATLEVIDAEATELQLKEIEVDGCV